MWMDIQAHSRLWLSLPLHQGAIRLQIRLEFSEDGTILKLVMCLDCARRQPSLSTPVWAGGFPCEGLIPSLDFLWSRKFRLAGAGAQLGPAKPDSLKPWKKDFGQCHCAWKHTYREPNSGTHTSFVTMKTGKSGLGKSSWLIKNWEILPSQILK